MNVLFPTTVDEALGLLQSDAAGVMAGGTDMLVKRRAGAPMPETLVCLEKLESFSGVEVLENHIRIGAATTMTAILESRAVRERLPLLHQAASVFASPLVRNTATIGGNICTASPAADTLPPLYILDAEVELFSLSGVRRMSVQDFIVGPGRTALQPGELLGSVIVPMPVDDTVHYFEKVGRRKALAIAVVSMAALLHVEDCVIKDVRLAFGSVGPTVVRCVEAEALLKDHPLTEALLRQAGESVQETIAPISDVRASGEYRAKVAANLLLRLI